MKRVITDKAVLHGEPVIEGTRVAVSVVLGSLADGMSIEEVKREYDLTDKDIRAALKYAAELITEDEVILLKKVS